MSEKADYGASHWSSDKVWDLRKVPLQTPKIDCPLLGYRICERTCKSCHYSKFWFSHVCEDLKAAAILGAFCKRVERIEGIVSVLPANAAGAGLGDRTVEFEKPWYVVGD